METEIWKDISGYEGLYQVSNFGKILSTKRKNTKGGILRPGSNPQGYEIASIYLNGVQKYYTVHRLVALAFIPQEEGKDQVNHKDGNKKNNTVDNLEWCTLSENLMHRHRILGQQVHNIRTVEQYSLDGEKINEFVSTMEAERQTGVSHSSIWYCCTHKNNVKGGFIWKYKKQPE